MTALRPNTTSRLTRVMPGNGRVSLFALYFKGTFYAVSFFAFYYYYFYCFINKTNIRWESAKPAKNRYHGNNNTRYGFTAA